MTVAAVIVSVTLLAVAALAVAVCRYHEIARDIETVVRNTPTGEVDQ